MRHRSWLMAIAAGLTSVGCVGLREGVQERLSTSRAHCLALAAWNDCGAGMASGLGAATEDFRSGYIAGYEEICNGGKGRVPVVPPAGYWRGDVTGGGPAQANAWFAGFREGVANAKRCGHDQANMVPTSCTPEPDEPDQPAPRRRDAKPRRGDPPKRATLPPAGAADQAATEKPRGVRSDREVEPRRAPPLPKAPTIEGPPAEVAPRTPSKGVAEAPLAPAPSPPMAIEYAPRPTKQAGTPVAAPPPDEPAATDALPPLKPSPKPDSAGNLPPFPGGGKKSSLPAFPGTGAAPSGLPPFPTPKPDAGGSTGLAPPPTVDAEVRPAAAANPEEEWSTPNSPGR